MGTKSAVIFYLCLSSQLLLSQASDLALIEDFSVGAFQRATRVVVDLRGTVYVLDADQNKIFVYDNFTDPPKIYGGFGWSPGSFDKPTGIATDGVNIYISDYGNHRIQRFDRKFNFISSIYTRDTSDVNSQFGYPLDVALSEQGDLFILDGENLRVLKFNPLYYFERTFGGINDGKCKLQYPNKLIVANSRVFVGEQNRIVIFDYFGNYLGDIGDGHISSVSGFTVTTNGVITASNDTISWFSQSNSFQKSMPLNQLISSEKITQIQDIAYSRGKLFILSPQKLYVFKMIN